MGILAKEIEHKLTQILLDSRKEVLQNGKSLKDEVGMIEDMEYQIDELRYNVTDKDETAQKKTTTKLIALLIQYQLKYL